LKQTFENETKIFLKQIHWHYLSEKGKRWLEFLNHDALVGTPVNVSHNRCVLRLPGNFYLKAFIYRKVQSLLKMAGGGNACREDLKNLELARRGISVPNKVLAFGCETCRGAVRRDLLITEAVANCTTLDRFIAGEFSALDLQSKRQLVADLASFMKNLHDKGVFHTDLHGGNIFITAKGGSYQFHILDLDRVRLKSGGLSRSECARNIALLLSDFWMLGNRGQRFRFLKDYGASADIFRDREFIRLITQTALKHSGRIWRSKARRSLSNNSRFVLERRGTFLVHRVRRPEIARILKELLPDPDLVLEKGEIMKDDRAVKAARIELMGRSFFLKRYNCKGWVYRFRNAFRRSRALRTWHATWGFQVRALPVPEALLCLEERKFRLLERSYVLSEFMQNTSRLSAVWHKFDNLTKQYFYVQLAILFGRMHQIGAFHGDLKWTNILIPENFDFERIVLCDMDAAKVYRRIRRKKIHKDLMRFMRDMKSFDKNGGNEALFYRIWKKWSDSASG
jgi:serine/threonine protein kinase